MHTCTLREAYHQGKQTLSRAGLQSPAFDALCLFEHAFGISGRAQLAVHGGEPADSVKLAFFCELIERRLREPLQYILGRWEFDGMALRVGEGVLIPREDTLALVQTACGLLGDGHSSGVKVLDLCAGTGAVGLAMARRLPDVRVICVEKSPEALPYLRQNIEEFGGGRVSCRTADVLLPPTGVEGGFDCIVSNPPYIPSHDVDGLAWEVHCEPRMALDGGNDGLLFYRAVCSLWKPLIRAGGWLAFEIGYDIRDGVMAIMEQNGIDRIGVTKDFNGIDRCVFGTVVS